MDLISVIVPVYKVEDYLDRCVESIVSQTYHNLEIILVNDGSPDKCSVMCEEWVKKDSRIRVVHKENGGLSDARNVGVEHATGAYIAFVDSDDWIEKEMLRKLYDRIKRFDSDIASCGALRVWDDGTPSRPMMRLSGDHLLEGTDVLKALIQSTYLIQVVWNKLYKTELIRNIPFETGKIHEDEFWSWQVMAKASQVEVLEENLYNYRQRAGSIMDHECTENAMLVLEAKLKRRAYIQKYVPVLVDIDNMDLLYSCHYLGCEVLKNEVGEKRNRYMSQLIRAARQCTFSRAYIKAQPLKRRFRSFFIRNNLKLVCWVDVVFRNA